MFSFLFATLFPGRDSTTTPSPPPTPPPAAAGPSNIPFPSSTSASSKSTRKAFSPISLVSSPRRIATSQVTKAHARLALSTAGILLLSASLDAQEPAKPAVQKAEEPVVTPEPATVAAIYVKTAPTVRSPPPTPSTTSSCYSSSSSEVASLFSLANTLPSLSSMSTLSSAATSFCSTPPPSPLIHRRKSRPLREVIQRKSSGMGQLPSIGTVLLVGVNEEVEQVDDAEDARLRALIGCC